MTIDTSDIM